jgi:NAD(P)-dependent dehydrogenase (short-subunit alcohol dehydrogenase family)
LNWPVSPYMSGMTQILSSFPNHFRALVFGARGGIGAAFVAALETRCQVSALTRSDIDICDEAALEALAARVKAEGPVHLVVNATGLLHHADAGVQPEKALKQISAASMAKVLAVNTIGLAHLSARVGSISDNRMGGWTSYRAAKAAQNMIVKNAAIETARRDPQKIIIGLHPGTVDTQLSAPFQGNVAAEKLFSPTQSADYLLRVIDGVTAQDSGKLLAWDGQQVPA